MQNSYVTGNSKLMAKLNAKLVLEAIYRAKQITRTDLSSHIGLQPATVGNIVSNLIEQGLVSEIGTNDRNGQVSLGRPARTLRFNDAARLVLAVDLEPDRIRVALMNLRMEIIGYSECQLDRFLPSEAIMDKIINGCKNVIDINPAWRKTTIGIGVSLPGLIDTTNGIAVSSTNMPNWKNVEIAKRLQQEIGFPVKIDKAMHLVTLSEKWRRPEIRDRNVLFLILRTGVGAGLLVKGQQYFGATQSDGEIGHTTIDINGSICECGNRGCLETIVSSTAIRKQASDLLDAGKGENILKRVMGDKNKITPEIIYQLANEGDPECILIVQYISLNLGIAAANLIQVLNPHELVICGSIDFAENIVLEQVRKVLEQRVLPRTFSGLNLLSSPFKDRASLFGAGVLIAEELFNLPLLTYGSPRPIDFLTLKHSRKNFPIVNV